MQYFAQITSSAISVLNDPNPAQSVLSCVWVGGGGVPRYIFGMPVVESCFLLMDQLTSVAEPPLFGGSDSGRPRFRSRLWLQPNGVGSMQKRAAPDTKLFIFSSKNLIIKKKKKFG